jgi:hypothetical protein
MIETEDYWISENKFVFKPTFNESIDKYYDLINLYDTLIFSNYHDLNICIERNNMCDEFKADVDDEFHLEYSIFNQFVKLPMSLTHLTFGNNFNRDVLLPMTLTHLTFGDEFNRVVLLPISLIHLTFGYNFNQPVKLPINLTHLTFGYDFNYKVSLPPNLTHLTFSNYFNRVVKLPMSLTHLTFGYAFNKKVSLPMSLTHLTFGDHFNRVVSLPMSLTHLTFGYAFNKKVDIPLKLKYLKLECNNLYLIENLPNNVEELELGEYFDLELNNLPNSVRIIKFHRNSIYDKELNNLVDSIEILQLPEDYEKKIKNIPKALKKIIISKYYEYIDDFKDYDIQIF